MGYQRRFAAQVRDAPSRVGAGMTDEVLTDATPAEVDPTAADLPDDVYTDEIVDTRTPEDI